MNFARIKPVKVHAYNPDWHVDVSRVVAYKAECDCGWRSPGCANVHEARGWLRAHRAEGCERAATSG